MRGLLIPATTPAYRTRSERFDDLVLSIVQRIEARWEKKLRHTEFAVEDVPASDPAPWERGGVPLARLFPAQVGHPARIVLYRKPIENRCEDRDEVLEVVRAVLVEQVAQLLGEDPDAIDPGYN